MTNKCQDCGRTDCLNILCHADLEVIKRESEKEGIQLAKKQILESINAYESEQTHCPDCGVMEVCDDCDRLLTITEDIKKMIGEIQNV